MSNWSKIIELELDLTRPVFIEFKGDDGKKIRKYLPKPDKTKKEYEGDITILNEMLTLVETYKINTPP